MKTKVEGHWRGFRSLELKPAKMKAVSVMKPQTLRTRRNARSDAVIASTLGGEK